MASVSPRMRFGAAWLVVFLLLALLTCYLLPTPQEPTAAPAPSVPAGAQLQTADARHDAQATLRRNAAELLRYLLKNNGPERHQDHQEGSTEPPLRLADVLQLPECGRLGQKNPPKSFLFADLLKSALPVRAGPHTA